MNHTLFNGDLCNKHTLFNGDLCNKRDSSISNKTWAFMATMTFWAVDYKLCHIYNDCDTSHNHTMFAPYQVVVGGDGTAMQAKSTGIVCFTSAITTACLMILMGLIDLVFCIGSRYVCL